MTNGKTEIFLAESHARMGVAEQKGLRLAIACRTAVTGAAFAWYVAAPLLFSEFEPRISAIVVLLFFTAIGIAHLAVIGTRIDRWWIKYVVYAIDIWAICLTFALVPISRADDVPQIIAFRAYGIYYLFPIVAVSCLSLSWRLVLWSGAMCVLAWWAAFVWVISGMEATLSWADIPPAATVQHYQDVFLSMDFIGRGNRIEETAMLFFAAIGLAVAVYRARAVFFAQVASELDWRRERNARERISSLLGRFVPQQVAAQLISDTSPLEPQSTSGTALVMDIAGFTAFSAQRSPEDVIKVLNTFFAGATKVISLQRGVVITYTGDGFLATFNAPVKTSKPEIAAVRAALELNQTAQANGFSIRVGLATGTLVTGTIGNDERQSFTVYGDAVNRAARLEALAKTLGEIALMDEATAHHTDITDGVHSKGLHRLQGFDREVEVFALGRNS